MPYSKYTVFISIDFMYSVLFRKKEKDRIQKLVQSHEPTNIAEQLKQTNKMGLVLPHITIVAIEIVGLPNITGAIVGKVCTSWNERGSENVILTTRTYR